MKLKNLRRPVRAEKAGISVPPPTKKFKSDKPVAIDSSPLDLADYEKHIKHLQKNYSSRKWSTASIMTLLELTSVECRRWISDD